MDEFDDITRRLHIAAGPPAVDYTLFGTKDLIGRWEFLSLKVGRSSSDESEMSAIEYEMRMRGWVRA